MVAHHDGESVYDQASPIYQDLEESYPDEAWRSKTAGGQFRPLFRDYPNSWIRTGVLSLANQRFKITDLGRRVLADEISKAQLLVDMFKQHTEMSGLQGAAEKPFAILAWGLLETLRPLATEEIYWAIMKNYRPRQDELAEVIRKKLPLIRGVPESTPDQMAVFPVIHPNGHLVALNVLKELLCGQIGFHIAPPAILQSDSRQRHRRHALAL
jgi:hypothetical protein